MASKKRLGIPSRWLKCPRKGSLFGDLFLPFKTPLDSNYDDQVPLQNRFTMEMLLSSCKQEVLRARFWGPRFLLYINDLPGNIYFDLGMIIDLTNTTRFYDRREVEGNGVKYVKLKCEGHQGAPTIEQFDLFSEIVDKFRDMNPDKKIGVHCTHGFNRTGFLIVSYMVEKMDWAVDIGVEQFALSRPPGIYKHDYLQELFYRFDDVSECPPAPQLPDWCLDEEDETEQEEAVTSNPEKSEPPAKKPKMIRGPSGTPVLAKEPKFVDGITGVFPVYDAEKIREVQEKVSGFCKWKRRSVFPGSQPVSMDMKNILKLAEEEYMVSWKADGTRYLMVCLGEGEVYLLDRDNCVYHAPTIRFFSRKSLPMESHLKEFLVDGEMVIDKCEGQSYPRFLIYDIIRYEGNEVGLCDFHRRRICIERELISPRQQLMREGRLDRTKEPFSIRQKHFWPVTTIRKILDGDFARQMSHEVDGLIFQPASIAHPYQCGSFPWLLKWKPPELNSIDFQLRLVTESQIGCLPETRGYLMVGGLDTAFSWIKVKRKEMQKYDNKIVECSYNMKNHQWQFMRQREDKSFPNHVSVAQAIVESIKNPVTKEILYNFIETQCRPPVPQFKAPEPPK